MPLVAGVDCSTQATKVVVVDIDSGHTVATGRAPHPVAGDNGARETHPEEWYTSLTTALEATGRATRIQAISVAAQQHGLVVLGRDRRPLRPAILWNDTRAVEEAARLVQALGGPAAATSLIGSLPGPAFTVSSWMWLGRHEPTTTQTVTGVCLPHDWLTEKLTGNAVTDRGDVSATGWWSTRTSAYLPEVLELPEVRLGRDALPRVLEPDEPAGQVSPRAAVDLGLRPGIVVGPGSGDNPATALGLGCSAGEPVLSLGTSGTVFTISTKPANDPTGTVVGLADATGAYLPLACTLNCTAAVDRIAQWLGLDRENIADDSGGVVLLPFFDGERTPPYPHATATVAGLRHATTPTQILRACYEGAVVSLLDALDTINKQSSGVLPDAPIVLAGGGARGTAWRQCLADLSGREIVVTDVEEPAARGAAVQAAAVLSGEPVTTVARRWAAAPTVRIPVRPVDTTVVERIKKIRGRLHQHNLATSVGHV